MNRTIWSAGLWALLAILTALPCPVEAQGSGNPRSGPVDTGIDATWRNFRRGAPSRTDDYAVESALGWGYRNPGQVGRMAEYYPPGNAFQNSGGRQAPARFDEGPVSTRRGMQLQSQMVGIARYNAIQGHIDRYGMPRVGIGFGFGFGGGFGGFGYFPY